MQKNHSTVSNPSIYPLKISKCEKCKLLSQALPYGVLLCASDLIGYLFCQNTKLPLIRFNPLINPLTIKAKKIKTLSNDRTCYFLQSSII